MTDLQCAPPQTTATTVLICDERPQALRELTTLLTCGAVPFQVTATPDAAGLLRQFGQTPADVVMIGVHPGSGTGITAMTLLLDPHPTALVIVYGHAQDTALLTSAVADGARGLLIWDTGRRSYPVAPPGRPRLGGRSEQRKPAAQLTGRESQILRGMSQGQSNGTIGRDLYLSEDTVKTHARRLFNKLGALDRAHAVAIGHRAGLL